mgnify:FL=1
MILYLTNIVKSIGNNVDIIGKNNIYFNSKYEKEKTGPRENSTGAVEK